MARILVVDDDEDVRELVAWRLTTDGYDVVLASGFEDALVAMMHDLPDVMVTDFAMPAHTGEDLLREAAARFPAMGRILFTGRRDAETRSARAAAHLVLQKGCDLAAVSAAVARCLVFLAAPLINVPEPT